MLKPKFITLPGVKAPVPIVQETVQVNRAVINWPTFRCVLHNCKNSPDAVKNFLERSGVEVVG